MTSPAAKMKKRTLMVSSSSKAINSSVSGTRVDQSARHTRSIAGSVSRKGFSTAGDSKSAIHTPRQTVRVFDEDGNDVTPRPLIQPEPAALQGKHNRFFLDDIAAETTSDIISMSHQTTTMASFTVPCSRSAFGSSKISRSSFSTIESMNEETEDAFPKGDMHINLPASCGVQAKREEVKEQLKEDMLDEVVDTYLSETETVTLLDMPGVCVSVDADDAEAIKERNDRYAELCKNRVGSDKYMERWMQTFNGAPKNKAAQCDRVIMVDAESQATTWDIYDSFCGHEQSETVLTPDPQKSGHPASGSSSQRELEPVRICSDDEPDPQLILLSEKFKNSLFVMERTILGNIFQTKLAAYRELPAIGDPDSMVKAGATKQSEESPLTPALECLWVFSCELTRGHNISSMAWNKKNPDLVAVGYGEFDFRNQKPGLVCCWSLQNPMWPGRVYHCDSGVTSLDFSAMNPTQLAVGMYDGTIAIYNVQSRNNKTCSVSTREYRRRHLKPVWQVKWTEQEMALPWEDKEEVLMSISEDGRMSKWFLDSNINCRDLIKLKRIPKKHGHWERTTGGEYLSPLSRGFCFDFNPVDTNIYLAGTHEGHIHRCSSYNHQQFLGTYKKHPRPVYRITWCPFNPDVFLSCSSDWTIQLWRQDLMTPVLGFSTTPEIVYDVMWSPKWATVFGAIKEGQVEIWDLNYSILDPAIVHAAAPGVKMTSLLFASQADCILVGDSDGQVSVYQLKNFNAGEGNQVDTLQGIITSAVARQL